LPTASIRPEEPPDYDAARRLHGLAFAPSRVEADLVDALRLAGDTVPDLCLVALDGPELIGHIVYSRARLTSGHEVLALAPMAVLPDRQRRGVGSALVSRSLAMANATGFGLVVVVGHPEYYPRFGFEPADAYGLETAWEIPREAWMALPLEAYDPAARGTVTYPAAFDAAG
jgi:putative acetyltransferase